MTLATNSRATGTAADASRRQSAVADADLLARFVRERDDEAFAEIVRRHGPMVLGVAWRVLADLGEAEDAFQATFLVFARRAAELKRPELLAGWLHGVAQRTSCKARNAMIRRQATERQFDVAALTAGDGGSPVDDAAWSGVLHEELSKLPEKYRAALVLCYLEGVPHRDAAARLGWPSGSMSRRLERGRELLRQRLLRRGMALPAVALIALLWQQAATAAVPARLVEQTVQSAMAAAGPLAAAGAEGGAAAGSAGGAVQTLKLLGSGALVLAALLAVLMQTPLAAYVPWGDGVSWSGIPAGNLNDVPNAGSGCCPESAAAAEGDPNEAVGCGVSPEEVPPD